MTDVEKGHIATAFSFELGKVETLEVRQRVVNMIARVSRELALTVADDVGVEVPNVNESKVTSSSPALSLMNTVYRPDTLKVAVIVDHGFNGRELSTVINAMKSAGLQPTFISEKQGKLEGTNGVQVNIKHKFLTDAPVVYDGVYVVGGPNMSETFQYKTRQFVIEQYNHYKPIGASQYGQSVIGQLGIDGRPGVVVADGQGDFAEKFINAMAKQRFWER